MMNPSTRGTMLSLPNILTLSRIFAIPLLAFLLWWPGWETGFLMGFALYCAMGVTDYFDGYLARSSGAVSRLGIFLDPIADKLLVGAALIPYVDRENILATRPSERKTAVMLFTFFCVLGLVVTFIGIFWGAAKSSFGSTSS